MKTLGYVALACGLAGQAVAGGIGEPVPEATVEAAPEAVASFDWSGFYVGFNAAMGEGDDDTSIVDTSGYGVQAGYLHDLGTLVVGGELAYSKTDVDGSLVNITATRLKLIGGYDAGRFLPYGFIGVSEIELTDPVDTFSDTVGSYGIGARYAYGASGQYVMGLEYIVEDKKNFANAGDGAVKLEEVALRFDYRF